jgi:peptidoglycan/LPS O-acetylase OafA/YrhL
MLREKNKTGDFNLFHFYIRRFLRIWPLYYLIMILGIFILPKLFFAFQSTDFSHWKNLFFLNNYDIGFSPANIGIAWSVAIEEQFYLIWPLLFIVFKSNKNLIIVSSLLFILSTLFVIMYPKIEHFHTLGNIRFLMVGCITAILYTNNELKFKSQLDKRNLILPFSILAFILILFSPNYKFVYYPSLILLPLLYLYIVVKLISLKQSDKITLTSKLGLYTYGMYLYHPTILIFTRIIFDLLKIDYAANRGYYFIIGILALIFTIVISYISYEYFEKRILKFKNKFASIKTRV